MDCAQDILRLCSDAESEASIDSPPPETLEQLRAENQRLRTLLATMTEHTESSPSITGFVPSGPPIWFDAVSDAIIITDATWHITHWNRAAEQIYGWPLTEVRGHLMRKIVPVTRYAGDDNDISALRTLMTAGVWHGEVMQHTRDGRVVVSDTSVRAFVDDLGVIAGYITVNRDLTDLTSAKVALRASEARFQAIWESASDAMALSDAKGMVLDANRAYCDLYCSPPEQVIGQHVATIFPPDQRAWAIAEYDEIIRTRTVLPAYEAVIPQANGATRVVESRATFVDTGDGQIRLLAIIRDITERTRAEDALRASEERFRAIIAHGGEGVILIDADQQACYVGPTIRMLLGYSGEIFAALYAQGLCHPDDLPWLDSALTELRRCVGATAQITTRLQHQDGSWRWIEQRYSNQIHNPAIGAIIVSLHDVTKRVRVAEALQATQQRLILALAAAQLTAWEWDLASDMITYSAHETSFLRLPAGHLSQSIAEVHATIYPPDLPAYAQAVAAALQHGAPYQLQVRVAAPDGTLRWLEIHGLVQHDGTGQPVRVVGVTRDNSARQQLQADAAASQHVATHALAQLDALVNSVPSGIAYLDDRLRFHLVNPAMAALNDRTPADLLGCTFADVLPGLAPQLEPIMRQVLATGVAIQDMELHYAACPQDGTVHDWQISIFPVSGPTGVAAGVGVMLTDITQRTRTATALHASEERFRLLAEHAHDVIYRYRLAPSITLEYLSPAIERVSGYAREAFARDPELSLRLVHTDDLPIIQRLFTDVASLAQPVIVRWWHQDGTLIWTEQHCWLVADEAGRPIVIEGIARDITARMRGEAALRAASAQAEAHAARLDSLLAHAPVGVSLLDTELRFQQINAHLAALNGHPPQAHLGHTIREMLPQLASELEAIYGQVLATGEPLLNVEVTGETLAAPGEQRIWNASYFPVRAASGTLLGAGVVVADITARRQAEFALQAHADALSRANAELTRALRLKDEFLAMMSHELRTPLNAILSITESLDEEIYGPVSARQRHALSMVMESGRNLLAILSDILDLTYIEAGQTTLDPQPITVDRLCWAALQLVQEAAQQKHIRVRHRVDQGLDGLVADERRLTQILVNLLHNAIKFTPVGGTVGMDVSADVGQERMTFVVWDTGIGIAKADYARLFRPFTQVDGQLSRPYGGVGLGLTLVRRLVELHGGSISMESTPAQGSRFSVSLPWAGKANAASFTPRVVELHPPIWVSPPQVVIADDHEPTLTVYRDLLTHQGYAVAVARTGEEAVAQVRATHPDVVVLDIQMPGMDGLEAIRRIRADPAVASVPIIALTALTMPGDRERCLAAGASVYLAKPVGMRALIAAMRNALSLANVGEEHLDG